MNLLLENEWALQILEIVAAIAFAPLLMGWVNVWRAWFQNRSAPSLFLPYAMLNKLFHKEPVVAASATSLFRATPYIVFGCMVLACGIVPLLSTTLPLSKVADVIALVGLLAFARVFISLAAMDIGTSFGTLGARREMMIGFLAEPALLMIVFSASLIADSTSLATIVTKMNGIQFALHPGLAAAGLAFIFVFLAENARVPVDNPATHLELTMIHEAMILEYSSRHLALIEWAASLKLLAYCGIAAVLFFPAGIASVNTPEALGFAVLAFVGKMAVLGIGLAIVELMSAKMRIFRVPEFLATSFLLAVIGVLVRVLLGE